MSVKLNVGLTSLKEVELQDPELQDAVSIICEDEAKWDEDLNSHKRVEEEFETLISTL